MKTTMTRTPDAMDDARRAAEGGFTASIVERLLERIGGHAGSQAVFGQPIERGEVTIIPVARVRWGFGGGGGSGPQLETGGYGSGSGGGGGVAADPIGYIEIHADGATFEPIPEPYPSPALLIAAGVTAAIVVRAFARLLRG
jgi:hypothetical protein